MKTHCRFGHEYTAESVYIRPSGLPDCRVCIHNREQKYLANSDHGIYKIYALTDSREPERVRYIGQTLQRLHRRMSQHFTSAGQGHRQLVSEWVTNTGRQHVTAVVLDQTREKLEAHEMETAEIAKYRTLGQADLNMQSGGRKGTTHDEFTRRRIIKSLEGREKSEATRKKMSQAQSGEKGHQAKLTPDQVALIRRDLHLHPQELADRFGVSAATIYDIRKYRSWKEEAA